VEFQLFQPSDTSRGLLDLAHAELDVSRSTHWLRWDSGRLGLMAAEFVKEVKLLVQQGDGHSSKRQPMQLVVESHQEFGSSFHYTSEGSASGVKLVESPMALGGVGVGASVLRLAGSAFDCLIRLQEFMI